MSIMAPEPLPEGEAKPIAELEVNYKLAGDVLKLSTSYGGASVKLKLDYSSDNTGQDADQLLAMLPNIVCSVLDDINQEDPHA